MPEYKGLKVEVKEDETFDQHYEAQLKYIKNLYAEFLSVEDPSVAGDMMKVSYDSDFELPADASASLKRAVKNEEGWFYLSEPEQIPGMLKAMTGAKKGDEVKFTAEFPADWREAGLAGKKVNYTVKVQEVQRRVPVESEEKLAEKLGMENVEKMHEFLKKKAENELEEKRKAQIREKVADIVVDAVPDFEMPKGVLGMASQRQFSLIADQLVRNEEDVEKFKAEKDKHLEEAKANAAKKMKKFFILRKIANAEKITVSEEEVDMQIVSRLQRKRCPQNARPQRCLLGNPVRYSDGESGRFHRGSGQGLNLNRSPGEFDYVQQLYYSDGRGTDRQRRTRI